MPALRFGAAGVRHGGRWVLRDLDWEVEEGQRWVVVGPNGAGKTTVIRLAAGYLHPTAGTVEILGQPLGRVDVRTLRTRVGLASAAVARLLRPELPAVDAVMTARHAALEPWWHTYTAGDRRRAVELLAAAGLAGAADQRFGDLSEGERQQVLIARTLMQDPELILLDEPAAGLDLGARERLVARLAALASEPTTPPLVFVTHHVEEVPPGFTHGLLLRDGQAVACGALEEAFTGASLSACFGLPVRLRREDGRWSARAGVAG